MLLVGAGLFIRSLHLVQSVDPGFGREPTAIMTFLTSATRFTPGAARVYTRRLRDRFCELPGVDAVGVDQWWRISMRAASKNPGCAVGASSRGSA